MACSLKITRIFRPFPHSSARWGPCHPSPFVFQESYSNTGLPPLTCFHSSHPVRGPAATRQKRRLGSGVHVRAGRCRAGIVNPVSPAQLRPARPSGCSLKFRNALRALGPIRSDLVSEADRERVVFLLGPRTVLATRSAAAGRRRTHGGDRWRSVRPQGPTSRGGDLCQALGI